MTRKVRVGIVGAGFGTRVHLPAFRSDPRCEVTAVCSSRRDTASAAAKKNGIPKAYGDWRKLIADPEIDAVAIAVPPDVQPQIVLAALRARKPVFCEKPAAVRLSDAKKLSRAASDARVANVIDFEFPEIPAWQTAKKMLENRKLGRLRHALLVWQIEPRANREKIKSWKTDSARGGGALQSFASHSLHYLEWLLGPVEALTARLRTAPGLPGPQDTLCMMRLFFRSGIYANVTVCTHASPGSGHRLEIYGDKGAIRLDNGAADYIDGFRLYHGARGDAALRLVKTPLLRTRGDGRIAAVSSLTKRFIDAISRGSKTKPDLVDACRVQTLIDAARRSNAASGKAVKCAIS